VYKKLIFRLTDVTQIIDAKNLGHIIFCVSALYMFVVMLQTAESIFFQVFLLHTHAHRRAHVPGEQMQPMAATPMGAVGWSLW
jgi:hypothetical protein